MGGRGSKSGVINRLPNYKNAVIPRDKLKNYLLNPNKDPGKSAFFNSLGYNLANYKRLESDIRKELEKNPAIQYAPNRYGHRAYSVYMNLGINKKESVLTGWQIDSGDNRPRLITAHKNEKKGK